MYPAFDDITSRIPEPPTWFDTNGTPRWGTFHPTMLGVHDRVAGLFEIACQSCGDTFLIGAGWTDFDTRECEILLETSERMWAPMRSAVFAPEGTIVSTRQIPPYDILRQFGFGDAPSAGPHRGCAGATMSSDGPVLRQAWRENDDRGWERDPQAEAAWWKSEGSNAETELVVDQSTWNEAAGREMEGHE